MSEQTSEVMDFLRAPAARQGQILDDLLRGQRDVMRRPGNLESVMAGLRRDSADIHGHIVGVAQRLDPMDDRLARMERRLGLAEPAL